MDVCRRFQIYYIDVECAGLEVIGRMDDGAGGGGGEGGGKDWLPE